MLRFAFTVSAFALTFIGKNHALSKTDTNFARASAFFALAGDYFLVVQNQNHNPGLFLFIFCQLFNYLRFTGLKATLTTVVILPIVFIVLPGSLSLQVRFGIIYAIAIFCALSGAIWAFKVRKYKDPNRHLIVIAMLFFVVCDVNVLLFNYPAAIQYQVYYLFLIWIFYLPAQLLLSLSRIKLN